jgi:hypothetical protein
MTDAENYLWPFIRRKKLGYKFLRQVSIGYFVVGCQQYYLGNTGSAIMWLGYSFSQIGLFMGLIK